MRIGIDIDGVLTEDDTFLLNYGGKFNHVHHGTMICPWAYEYAKFDWNEELIEEYRRTYFPLYVTKEPARPFASEVIQKLRSEGNEIFIITARYATEWQNEDGARMRKAVEQWLRQNEIPYDHLIFTDWTKVDACKQNKIEVMIEDSPDNIPILSKFVSILCFDARYNQMFQEDMVTRCYSWYDIYEKIEAMKQEGQ